MDESTEQTIGAVETQEAEAPGATEETISKAEHQRELDRYRNEMGQLKKRLKELEDASKSEAEKLAERAAKADALEPELESYRAAVAEEVEARKKQLPKEILELLPEGSPASQLSWLRKAQAAAEKVKPTLPPAGGRAPAEPAEAVTQKVAVEGAMERFHTLRNRRLING